MKSDKPICIYCGKNPKETADHVPPKSYYPKPRPSDLITVPSCLKCNHGAGKDEEFFLATFMFSDAGISEAGKQLWSEKMHRAYEKNIGLKRKIADSLKRKEIVTPAGIILGNHWTIKTDQVRFENVVNKIVRGLYYHELHERLAPSSEILSLYLSKEQHFNVAEQHIDQLKHGSNGWKGIFEYRFNILEEDPNISMWLLRFYNCAYFFAITGDSQINNEHEIT